MSIGRTSRALSIDFTPETDLGLLSSAAYSRTAGLKNLIDSVAQPEEGEQPLACVAGKVAGIMAVSPGKPGGSRGRMHLRTILQGVNVHVVAYQVSVAESSAAFNSKGELVEPSLDQGMRHLGRQVCTQIKKMSAASAGQNV
jgi:NAD(P)H-dependent FMN reductase